ncbi:hypothetical protein [Vibrio europaeus]|uniref:hypothetical protein n=1 Tax=Vibrio europaeus TaxID=300876 RepID=UPI00233E9D66|nr:hypothetical protein [Vibrio europaeus]MDC5753565.1 hypothetical protein [Vibrio europaeus]MDC5816523.1 hypothetical protein [Vibrio europaeus]
MLNSQVGVQKVEPKNLAFFTKKYEDARISSISEDEVSSYIKGIENDVRAQQDVTKDQQECLSYLYSLRSQVVGHKAHAGKR